MILAIYPPQNETEAMAATLQIPLDIPDIRLLSSRRTEKGELLLQVESTLEKTPCQHCGRELKRLHGLDRTIRLRHLPILEQPVLIEIRPKRFLCPDCNKKTTTQRLDWYELNSPHTKAFDRWLLKMLINATVSDVSRRCGVGYAAVEGSIERQVSTEVDWDRFERIETLGLDEIALKKGHGDFVAVVTCRDNEGRVSVLGVLPDRLKETVVEFLSSIPERLQATIKRVCSDMYEGYINAAREVFPGVEIVVDRFHVAKNYHAGADRLRKQAQRELKQELPEDAYAELKGVLWVFRRHWWDLDEDQQRQLATLFTYSSALREAYFLRHQLTVIFIASTTKVQGLERIDQWREKVMDSGLSCFDSFLTTLENWGDEIANYFNDRHSSGFVEGMNNKLKVIKRRCYGLLNPTRLFQRIQIDLEGERLLA